MSNKNVPKRSHSLVHRKQHSNKSKLIDSTPQQLLQQQPSLSLSKSTAAAITPQRSTSIGHHQVRLARSSSLSHHQNNTVSICLYRFFIITKKLMKTIGTNKIKIITSKANYKTSVITTSSYTNILTYSLLFISST
jgi:hypothetical protein